MPRRLLRDGAIVVDEWRTAGDGTAGDGTGADDPVADDAALMLALPEFRAERERWLARPGPLGVILAPADDEQELVPDLARLALVAARTSVFMVNFGFWIGSLWGDDLLLVRSLWRGDY